MNEIEKFIEDMDEWDTVFDPIKKEDKCEYTHEQLVRFAELWAKKQLEEHGKK